MVMLYVCNSVCGDWQYIHQDQRLLTWSFNHVLAKYVMDNNGAIVLSLFLTGVQCHHSYKTPKLILIVALYLDSISPFPSLCFSSSLLFSLLHWTGEQSTLQNVWGQTLNKVISPIILSAHFLQDKRSLAVLFQTWEAA